MSVVPHLLYAMGNTAHSNSQRQASLALKVLYDICMTILVMDYGLALVVSKSVGKDHLQLVGEAVGLS